jgi:CubicO group peptidase (beta-lactamase class C family)
MESRPLIVALALVSASLLAVGVASVLPSGSPPGDSTTALDLGSEVAAERDSATRLVGGDVDESPDAQRTEDGPAEIAAPEAAGPLPVAALETSLRAWAAERPDVDGVVVGVAVAGDESDEVWIGEGDGGGPGMPIDAGDSYGVLSITKTFTEALVLREAAAGRIALDEPMPLLPGVGAPPAGVVTTPRMLLQHSSGLVNYMDAVGYDPAAPITPAQIVTISLQSPLVAPPGTQAHYSNTNFHWLGLLLESVTGRTYGELVAALAAEFGLNDTRVDPASRPGWVGYASGGISSTVEDMTRWGAALFTPGAVLPAAQLSLLTTIGHLGVSHGLWPVCPCGPAGNDPADAEGVAQFVAHGGFVYFPDEEVVVVIHLDKGSPSANAHTASLASRMLAAIGHPEAYPG